MMRGCLVQYFYSNGLAVDQIVRAKVVSHVVLKKSVGTNDEATSRPAAKV